MTNPTQPFNNSASQAERREELRQQTLQFRTAADLGLENSGRFAKPFEVIGSSPTPQYPQVAPNWANDPTGVEPPLGYSIDEAPVVGESFEVQASIDALGSVERSTPPDGCRERPSRSMSG